MMSNVGGTNYDALEVHVPSRGRYFSLCASVPKAYIGCITSDDWTLIADRYPLSTLREDMQLL